MNVLDFMTPEWWVAKKGDPFLQHIVTYEDAMADAQCEDDAATSRQLERELQQYELTVLERWFARQESVH